MKFSPSTAHVRRSKSTGKRVLDKKLLGSVAGILLTSAAAILPAQLASAGSTFVSQPTGGGSSATANTPDTAIAVGINAVANGTGNGATQGDALAVGDSVNAIGQDTTAFGDQTSATATNSMAFGNLVAPTGDLTRYWATYNNPGVLPSSLPAGTQVGTLASGQNSMAFGVNSLATGDSAVTYGPGAWALADETSAIGGMTTASAIGATALGFGSNASANYGVALGFGSVANRGPGTFTPAFLTTATTTTYGAVSVGTTTNLRQINNLAGGTQGTDAVNVNQLFAAANALAGSTGGSFDPTTGIYTTPNYTVGGVNYTNVQSALAATNALAVTYTPNGAGLATNVVDLTKGGSLQAVSITGLAAATLSANSTGAVNGSQLYATNQTVANLSAALQAIQGGNGLVQQASSTSPITVGSGTGGTSVNFTNSSNASRVLTGVGAGSVTSTSTNAVNGSQLYAANAAVATSLGGGAQVSNTGALQGPNYQINGQNYTNVGSALAALNNPVQYDINPATGARGNSVTLAGGDPTQPVLISNVATGVAPTDAANTGQVTAALTSAKSYTDQRVGALQTQVTANTNQIAGLQGQMSQTLTEARQAAAVGLAASALRYDDRPGKLSVAMGGGLWEGQGAASFGAGYTATDGRVRANVSGVATSRDVGVNAGVSLTLN